MMAESLMTSCRQDPGQWGDDISAGAAKNGVIDVNFRFAGSYANAT